MVIVVSCGGLPEPSKAPAVNPNPAIGNCKSKRAEVEDVTTGMCPAPKVVIGLVSFQPFIIRCAINDIEC